MAKQKTMDVLTTIVEALTPLQSEERMRAVRAALVILGETGVPSTGMMGSIAGASTTEELSGDVSARARTWMRQNGIEVSELEQVFHVANGSAEVIASHMPGKNKKEQTYNAYMLTGVAQLLSKGSPSFSDKDARALCESSGCYDSANHAAHLKERGNEFTGTKDKGWVLTAPGLKRAAELIKDLNKPQG